jgi:hypothetical protein
MEVHMKKRKKKDAKPQISLAWDDSAPSCTSSSKETDMSKAYRVEVNSQVTQTAVVTVAADSEDEAKRLAVDVTMCVMAEGLAADYAGNGNVEGRVERNVKRLVRTLPKDED